MLRLGKPKKDERPRPILISLKELRLKDIIFANLYKLKSVCGDLNKLGSWACPHTRTAVTKKGSMAGNVGKEGRGGRQLDDSQKKRSVQGSKKEEQLS